MSNELMVAGLLGGSTCTKDANGAVIDAEDLYQVLTDNLLETPDNILEATGMPQSGDPHPCFEYLFATKIVPRQDVDGQRWVVRVTYGKGPAEAGIPPEGATSIDFKVGSWEEEEDWTHDAVTNWLIRNTRGDILPFTFTRPVQHPQYIVSIHYETAQSYDDHTQFSGTVNDSPISIRGITLPTWTAKLKVDISDPPGGGMDVVYTITVRKHEVTWTDAEGVHTNTEIGWHEVLPNVGFYHWDTAKTKKCRAINYEAAGATPEGVIIPALDEHGKAKLIPASEPVALALDGTRQPEAVHPALQTIYGIGVYKYPNANWRLPFD